MTTTPSTAADHFVNALKTRGVTWVATLCGHGLEPLYFAATKVGLRLVDTRNEQTASYMAEAYGRLTRRAGVCAVSSGVAHINALTGLANAWFDSSPMLLVTGEGAVRTAGLGHFQDMDHTGLARPLARYARRLDHPARTLEILDAAFHAAEGPPPGPAQITFPLDVQNTPIEEGELVKPGPPTPWRPAETDPEEIARRLSQASQPLIVAGSGLFYAGASEAMLHFAERFSIPVAVPIWDRGPVNRVSDTFVGVLGAATGGPRLLADADCILLAGAAVDYRIGFLQPDAVRPEAALFRLTHGFRELLALSERRGLRAFTSWLAEARRRRVAFRQAIEDSAAAQARAGTHAVHVLSALRRVMTEDAVLLVDGGAIGQWFHQLLCDRYPEHWLTCGRSGVVGWGIGGAMAARLAFPDRPVILLSGDGAFTFTVADLESAVRQRLPFVAVVADDQAWGITKAGHERQFGQPIASTLGPIALDRLAEALGARGLRLERAEQIAPALEEALGAREVTVLHVPVVGGLPAGSA
ncbi:MAG: thiamine pyrophosphate-binding protein [Bryobacterales bacterium]|nr:thiamine pyrophosphate-binding protein [Bryobacteraceae bacterium]MDW8355277.1 thiamine pyrophosphate-binding protein [Bryobacterales bacterium]